MRAKETYLISKTYFPKETKTLLLRKGIISIDQLCGYTKERLRKTLGIKRREINKLEKYLKHKGMGLFKTRPDGSNDCSIFPRIAILFRRGETLQDIGEKFNLSRERIRQIIRDKIINEKDLIDLKKEHIANDRNYNREAREGLIIYLKSIAKNFYLITDFVKETRIPLNIIHMYLPEIAEVFNQKRGAYRATVIKNFKFCCVKCGLSQTESMIKYDKDLYVYHKNGNKKDASLKNLIPLCLSCFLKEARKNKQK